jgi:TPR repeat protein
MKSNRTPDRVHVVSQPENDDYVKPKKASTEIIRTLAKISDKLKRSEAERYELLSELRDYRQSLRTLEDKSRTNEKSYQNFESKLKDSGVLSGEQSQRQQRFEKSLKATEDKMLKSIAGQAIMDKRMQDSEDRQDIMDQRLDRSVSEQARLNRQLELVQQDKNRMIRKVERLEEIVLEAQDMISAQSSAALLSDETKKRSNLSAPSWSNVSEDLSTDTKEDVIEEFGSYDKNIEQATQKDLKDKIEKVIERPIEFDETKQEASLFFNAKNMSIAALAAAALLMGWAIHRMQDTQNQNNLVQSNVEQAQQLELAQVVSTEDINNAIENSSAIDLPESVIDYSDDQLMNAFNDNPDALAEKLNSIEPSGVNSSEQANRVIGKPNADEPAIKDPQITAQMKDFDKIAYRQDPKIKQLVMAEKPAGSLSTRIKPDTNLSNEIKPIEVEAFKGNAEAQHDLAAIYTAGHAKVDQDFQRAALWFREASDNGIANARYNLGVLYHQGLGKDRDLSRALYWYREAAKIGHAEAQYNLGIAHIEGIGTEYNPQLAAEFFERSANQGIMEAAYNLGLIHDNGLMGQSKPEEALLWYKIAADQGSNEASDAMAQLAKTLQIGMDDVDKLYERMQMINQSVKGHRAGPKDLQGTSAVNNSSQAPQDPKLIIKIQEYLMLTGTYAGPADGINGPATQAAIRLYQMTNNLEVDGQISKPLLENMINGAMGRLEN